MERKQSCIKYVCSVETSDVASSRLWLPVAQDLRASIATVALQNAIGAASANDLFILTSVALVERTAVCGNQVCEPGERVPAGSGIGAHALPLSLCVHG